MAKLILLIHSCPITGFIPAVPPVQRPKKQPRERPCKEWSHDETIEENCYFDAHMMASTMSCLLTVLVLRSKMPMMSLDVAV